jgi:tetratricopeptide (TPR) repeat protein
MVSDLDRLNLLLDLRRYAEAEKAARDAIAREPQQASAYTHLARALLAQNKKEAIEAAKEGVRKAPQDAWAVGTLACVLNWFSNFKEALEPAEQAVKLNPRYAWAYAMLANILYNLGRFKEAHERTVEGLRLDPLSESLFRWKGWAEHKLNNHEQALQTGEEGLKHHPNSHLLLNLVGCVKWMQAEKLPLGLTRLRLHREADKILRDAIRIDPTQSAYHDNLRNNAMACRRNLVGIGLPLMHFAIVVIPVCVLSAVFLSDPDPFRAVCAGALTLLVFGVFCAVARDKATALAFPLTRFDVPTPPQTEAERREGLGAGGVLAFLALVPYALLIWAILRWPFS